TYFADAGDFSAAGTAAFDTFRSLPQSFVQFTGGEHNYYRMVGAQSVGENNFIGLDLTASDGPWVNPEHLRKANFTGHFIFGNWAGNALGYLNDWNSTDQVPLRAIQSGDISRLGVIDPSDGGHTSRIIVSARNRDLDGWDTVGYLQKYDLKLWSNF